MHHDAPAHIFLILLFCRHRLQPRLLFIHPVLTTRISRVPVCVCGSMLNCVVVCLASSVSRLTAFATSCALWIHTCRIHVRAKFYVDRVRIYLLYVHTPSKDTHT